MKILALLLALLPACASVPKPESVSIDSTPQPAAYGAFLVESLEISMPVWIYDRPVLQEGNLGVSYRLAEGYVIYLEPSLTDREKIQVLMHELAHVVAWDRYGTQGGDHGPAWGQAMSDVFQVYAGEDTPDSQ